MKEIIEKNFKIFGFLPIETPTIEYEELAKGDNERDAAVSENRFPQLKQAQIRRSSKGRLKD